MAVIPQSSFQGPLAPKNGLGDNARNQIPGAKMPSRRRNLMPLVPVGILALALLILPITVQQLNQRQSTSQNASGITPTIVVPTSVVQPTTTPQISPTGTASNSGTITP